MATTYRYLFADLLTNQILAELPLTSVTFTEQLNVAGTFTGHLLLSGVDAAALNVNNATIPGRCVIYVDRNGVLVWGGIIWLREYSSTEQRMTLTAREFLSYYERRRISDTLPYTGYDQMAIAQNLMNYAESKTYGSIGLLFNQDPGSSSTSGVIISRVYYNYEIKTVFQAIQDLSKANNGFDFEISVYYDGSGNPAKSFNTYYPHSGNRYSATNPSVPVFELPGNIVEYTYPEDGSKAANEIFGLGAGSTFGKLIETVDDATKLATGWPLLQDQGNYTDIYDPTLLTSLTQGQLNATSYPPVTMKIAVPAYIDPIYGTYEIGDDVRVRITDSRFPSTLDAVYRITALSIDAGEDRPERVTLTVTQGSI